MKQFFNISSVLILLLLAGCSIEGYDDSSVPVTDQETQLAGQIIGESISENQRGILSSFSEAFAVPAASGLRQGPSLLASGSFRNQDNYSHTYDAATGEHTVTYTVRSDSPQLSLLADVELTYLFLDAGEEPVEQPYEDMDRIEAVDFRSQQTGTITSGSKNSVFTRTDRILMNGLNDQSDILTLDGFHSGEGVFSDTTSDGSQIEREYLLDMNYLDIRIDKDIVIQNRNFRNGVNGALSYESTVRDIRGSSSGDTKIVNGTIELNGDGTALLNFREQVEPIRIRLDDGELFDDDEFEGRITQVDLENSFFVLTNGQRIQLNTQTEIDDGDFQSLREVNIALQNNRRVVAEGDYFQPDESVNLWIATEVEFEEESNEFEERVQSIDLNGNSLLLITGDRLFWTNQSDIDFDDDLQSLQEVSGAINSGLPVVAEGDFSIDPDSGDRLVNSLSFELEFKEFESEVASVDTISNTFTLNSGRTVFITAETAIDGSYPSLEAVQQALDQGLNVEADGQYYRDLQSDNWVATEVTFDEGEGEEDDDDGDGDGDGDGDEDGSGDGDGEED